MFSSPLLSPQRDELSLPATSKVLLTSLLISIISTYRSHIRRPFDGTIHSPSLEYVLVHTAVSTTRRALSPCDVEGSLDKPVNLDNQHLSQPHLATFRLYDSPSVYRPYFCRFRVSKPRTEAYVAQALSNMINVLLFSYD